MAGGRILCCADLHLGRSSAWMGGPEDADRTALGAWRRIVEAALAESALAVLIAGDVFDSTEGFYSCRRAFAEGVRHLGRAKIPVIAVAGNHDWADLPSFQTAFADAGLILLGAGGRWESHMIGGIRIAGWSFQAASAAEAPPIPPWPDGAQRTIALVHADLDDPKSRYNPMSEAGLEDGRYGRADYWVLGHIHKPRIRRAVAYPGSPQALDFGPGERGPHGFCWLSLEPGGEGFSELVPLSTVLFDEMDVAAGSPDELLPAMVEAAERLRAGSHFLQSVQLRVRAILPEGSRTPNLDPERDAAGRHCVQVVEVRREASLDLWSEAAAATTRGEAARLLLGLRAEMGSTEGAEEEWRRHARDLIERGARDARELYQSGLGRLWQQEGDLPEPDEAAARTMAAEALDRRLMDLLGGRA